jgi:Protein of unknown function (DUF732)
MDFDRITHPLRLARGSHQPGSAKGCAMNVIADERLVRPLLRGVNHSSEEIHVGDSQAGDQPRTRTRDSKTPPGTPAALSSGFHNMNYSQTFSKRWTNKGSLMLGKLLVGAVGVVISVGLAAPAGAAPVPEPNAVPDFLAAVRAAGITGTDPAILEDGYSVCRRLWVRQMPGTQVAAGLVQDHPQLTTDQAGQFVLAAYHDLCPVPAGSYDYWAYSTG